MAMRSRNRRVDIEAARLRGGFPSTLRMGRELVTELRSCRLVEDGIHGKLCTMSKFKVGGDVVCVHLLRTEVEVALPQAKLLAHHADGLCAILVDADEGVVVSKVVLRAAQLDASDLPLLLVHRPPTKHSRRVVVVQNVLEALG